MLNKFKYSNDNKRYHTFNYYLRNKYKSKVAKIPLDAGFTCPNRDGTKSFYGCIFCSEQGSGEFTSSTENIEEQFEESKSLVINKWPDAKFIAYFQAYTNTYGPLEKIKNMVDPFIDNDEVVAISIATRADCLEDETIEYLNSLTHIKDIWIELGLQSSNDVTAKYINRCHDFNTFKEAVFKLSKTNLKICVHLINGLPYETKDDMINTIKDINTLPIHGVKIHMLSVVKNTLLSKKYEYEKFHLLTLKEYVDIVVNQLRLLKEEVVIQRLTGDPVKEDLIMPKWLPKKTIVLNEIDKYMAKNDYYQGDLLKGDLL